MPQQFVILSKSPSSPSGELAPIGDRADILRQLFDFNTGPERNGEDVLYGPGLSIELPPGQDPLTQMLLTITEEEVGWLVLLRMARRLKWRILDPNTGREFTPSADQA